MYVLCGLSPMKDKLGEIYWRATATASGITIKSCP